MLITVEFIEIVFKVTSALFTITAIWAVPTTPLEVFRVAVTVVKPFAIPASIQT